MSGFDEYNNSGAGNGIGGFTSSDSNNTGSYSAEQGVGEADRRQPQNGTYGNSYYVTSAPPVNKKKNSNCLER